MTSSQTPPSTWRRTDVPADLVSVLPELLNGIGALRIALIYLQRPFSLHTGDLTPTADELIRAARIEYRARGYGFWDSLLTTAIHADEVTRRALLSRVIQHNAAPPTAVPVGKFVTDLRKGAFFGLSARDMVSLSSRIETADGSGHVPMLDFSVPHSSSADDIAIEVATALDIRGGYLLRSGTSYHLLGDYLLSWDETIDLLARAQLLSPLIDHRWAAHQLIDRFCALRISTDDTRHPTTHILIASTHAGDVSV
ncbi:primase 1D-like protein [Mycolicibacterium helvum]|uniref:Uncharacterized protein n=1 Tax=Mycolicibacterium helvum TaxID=1534349 RepID=A0A7I7T1T5_9MYCO|nr:hypothetical protein [Mycolicibacterium helvum]BBY62036.1 hypothetical protein MHEL_02790 [Mycolicibacterium helvum]